MLKTFLTLILISFSLTASNVYADYSEDLANNNNGMPKQVKLLNQRQIECNHWAGEEAYDVERGKEISAAMQKLKCAALEKDEKILLKKYKSQPNVINSIHKAKQLI